MTVGFFEVMLPPVAPSPRLQAEEIASRKNVEARLAFSTNLVPA